MAANTKLRVLCLHGYRQSGPTFHKKTGAFRKILKASVDFVDVTSPNQMEGLDDTGEAIFSWFDYEVESIDHFLCCNKYSKMEETIAFLQKVFKEQGPFDGILGFSQGGVLASILCGMRKSLPGNDVEGNNIEFSFALIVSAFPTCVPDYSQYYTKIESTFTSLHSYGTTDTLVLPEHSKRLVQAFPSEKRVIIEHPGGHYVPTTSQAKSVFKAFFADQLAKKLAASK